MSTGPGWIGPDSAQVEFVLNRGPDRAGPNDFLSRIFDCIRIRAGTFIAYRIAISALYCQNLCTETYNRVWTSFLPSLITFEKLLFYSFLKVSVKFLNFFHNCFSKIYSQYFKQFWNLPKNLRKFSLIISSLEFLVNIFKFAKFWKVNIILKINF